MMLRGYNDGSISVAIEAASSERSRCVCGSRWDLDGLERMQPIPYPSQGVVFIHGTKVPILYNFQVFTLIFSHPPYSTSTPGYPLSSVIETNSEYPGLELGLVGDLAYSPQRRAKVLGPQSLVSSGPQVLRPMSPT